MTVQHEQQPIRIMLVDDHRMVLAGLRMILEVEPGIEIVAEAAEGAQAVQLATRLQPDVVCMDVQMPVMDGIEATERILAERGRTARVLMLTTFRDEQAVAAALRAGASGFVLKNSPPETLIEAIRVVHAGDALLDPQITRGVIETMRGVPEGASAMQFPSATASRVAPGATARLRSLTEREREVLLLVAEGLSNAEIARRIFVSDATVKTHVSNLLAKLGVHDRIQAVIYAYDHGVVAPRGAAGE